MPYEQAGEVSGVCGGEKMKLKTLDDLSAMHRKDKNRLLAKAIADELLTDRGQVAQYFLLALPSYPNRTREQIVDLVSAILNRK